MGTSHMKGAKLHLRHPNSLTASSMKLGVDLSWDITFFYIHIDIIVPIYNVGDAKWTHRGQGHVILG